MSDKNIDLNLLRFRDQVLLKDLDGKKYIYDPIRKKFLILQPEELVRQLCIQWLIDTKIHRNAIQVEKLIKINGLSRRFDIVVYDSMVTPQILVECKAPDVKITQATFDQIASYQMALNAPYLIVTNGVTNFIAHMNHERKEYEFYHQIPVWA